MSLCFLFVLAFFFIVILVNGQTISIESTWNDTNTGWNNTTKYISGNITVYHGWFDIIDNNKIWFRNFSCIHYSTITIDFTCNYGCGVELEEDGCRLYFNDPSHSNISLEKLYDGNSINLTSDESMVPNNCSSTHDSMLFSASAVTFTNSELFLPGQEFEVAFETYATAIANKDKGEYLGISFISVTCNQSPTSSPTTNSTVVSIESTWNDTNSKWINTDSYVIGNLTTYHGWFDKPDREIWYRDFSCLYNSTVTVDFTCNYGCDVEDTGGSRDYCILYFNEPSHSITSLTVTYTDGVNIDLSLTESMNVDCNTDDVHNGDQLFSGTAVTYADSQLFLSGEEFEVAFGTHTTNADYKNENLGISFISVKCNQVLPTIQPTLIPTVQPNTRNPTTVPTIDPSGVPSAQPTNQPSIQPSNQPTTDQPTKQPMLPTNTLALTTESSIDQSIEFMFTAILIILSILLIISCISFFHKTIGKLPCFMTADDAKVLSLLTFALQILDFSSDINFSLALSVIASSFLFPLSLVFLFLPWALNVIWLLIQRRSWAKHPIVNVWIRNNGWFLMALTMVSGNVNSCIKLCNSRLLGLKIFSMNLPKYEYIKLSKWPILISVVFENMPQIALQAIYLFFYADIENASANVSGAAYFSLCSSAISVFFALMMLVLQSCGNFDDCQFAIHLTIDDRNHNEQNLTKKLGERMAIANAIAKVLEMDGNMIVVDRIIHGYQRLVIYISIAGYVAKKDINVEKVEERKEDRVDHLLGLMNTERNNGRLSSMFGDVLQLEYNPSVYKIADIVVEGGTDVVDEQIVNRKDTVQVNINMGVKQSANIFNAQQFGEQPVNFAHDFPVGMGIQHSGIAVAVGQNFNQLHNLPGNINLEVQAVNSVAVGENFNQSSYVGESYGESSSSSCSEDANDDQQITIK